MVVSAPLDDRDYYAEHRFYLILHQIQPLLNDVSTTSTCSRATMCDSSVTVRSTSLKLVPRICEVVENGLVLSGVEVAETICWDFVRYYVGWRRELHPTAIRAEHPSIFHFSLFTFHFTTVRSPVNNLSLSSPPTIYFTLNRYTYTPGIITSPSNRPSHTNAIAVEEYTRLPQRS